MAMVTPRDCSANIAPKAPIKLSREDKRVYEGHVVFNATATRGRDAAGTPDIFVRHLPAA